ncbi:MAG: hypothetical protein ACQERF_08590 [Actinomycetota bacterium]
MAAMAVEQVTIARVTVEWTGDFPCDERCVWCEAADAIAHTVDGFCEFCGATGHPCR